MVITAIMAINGFISHIAFTCANSIILQTQHKCIYYEDCSLVCHFREKLLQWYSVYLFCLWKNHVKMFCLYNTWERCFYLTGYLSTLHSTVVFALKAYLWPSLFGSNLELIRYKPLECDIYIYFWSSVEG